MNVAAPSSSGSAAIALTPRGGELPLSFNQEGCLYGEWLARLRSERVPLNHVCNSLHFDGPLDLAALRAALGGLVERHEVLRTSFTLRARSMPGEGPFGLCIHREAAIDLVERSIEHAAPGDRWAEVARLAEEAMERPFDYERPPLMRAVLVRLQREEHVLLMIAHHLICDGWSFRVLRGELESAYRRAVGEAGDAAPALPCQYIDFAAWERCRLQGSAVERLVAYWQQYWEVWEPEVLTGRALTGGLPRAAGAGPSRPLSVGVDPGLAERIRGVVRSGRSTLYGLCLAAVGIVLHRRTGRSRLALWGHYANRRREEFERLLGWFATSHITGIDLSGDPDVATLLARARAAILNGFTHQELPLPLLLRRLSATAGPRTGAHPAFDRSRIAVGTRTVRTSRAGQTTISPVVVASGLAGSIALQVMLVETDASLSLLGVYATDQCAPDAVRRILHEVATALEVMVAAPEARVSTVAASIALAS